MEHKNILDFFKDCINKNEFTHLTNPDIKKLNIFFSPDNMVNYFEKSLINPPKNVYLSGFRNGKSCDVTPDKQTIQNLHSHNLYDDLSKLSCSLRITNIQELNKPLKKMCFDLYRALGRPVTINMYITPKSGKDCFLTHPDTQETFAFQSYGRKKWFIPLDDEGDKIIAKSNQFEGQVKKGCDYFKFNLLQDEIAYLPHCTVHKAEAFKDELSIHFTFAVLNHWKTSFKLHLEDLIDSLIEYDNTSYEKLTEHRLKKWSKIVASHLVTINETEIENQIIKKIQTEDIKILKYGRPYKSGTEIVNTD